VGGRAVLPGFVDSHAHLVFAGDRAREFEARMSGQPYDGGGIASTVRATRAASDDELRARLAGLVAEMRRQGTTTVEVKSGYGLTVQDEARALRLAGEVTRETTYLGAHVVPPDMAGDRDAYVELVTGEMLQACAPFARWVDVFCEPASVDALAGGTTVATLLPGVEFSTRSPYPDARRLLGAGVTVALATDCNPGSCFTSSMAFCIALAVREMSMTPAEAVWAATAGGAAALRRSDVGSLVVGARADLAVVDAPSFLHLAYRPGVPLVRTLELTES
jgi:imidazolonepropionase